MDTFFSTLSYVKDKINLYSCDIDDQNTKYKIVYKGIHVVCIQT